MKKKKNTIFEMPLFVSQHSPSLKDDIEHARQFQNEELLTLWLKAEKGKKNFSELHSFSGKLHDIEQISPSPSPTLVSAGSQLSTNYVLKSIEAFQKNNFPLANEQLAISQSIGKASEVYYQYLISIHRELLNRYSFNEEEQVQAVLKYRSHQAQALDHGNKALSQQWAEAACLAQEAITKTKKAKNEALSYYWRMASAWAYRASILRAVVAEAAEKNKEEKVQLHTIARCAEQASSYRTKAAQALCLENPVSICYWTSAALWSGNACHYLQQELFHMLPAWKTYANQALLVASSYAKAAESSISSYLPLAYERYWAKRALKLEKKLQSQVGTFIASLTNPNPLLIHDTSRLFNS